MKKLFLILIPVLMFMLLSACSSNKELYCEYEVDSETESIKIVYNDDEIISVYENGEKLTQSEIDEGINLIIDEYGNIPDFIDAYEELMTSFGNGTCTRK